jgi:hypothetical protein
MALNRSVDHQQAGHALAAGSVSVAEAHRSRVADEGSGRHPHLQSLLNASGTHAGRDLADAMHLLCSLHGRFPGLIQVALQGCGDDRARAWLVEASDAFERERLFLVRLTSAVGPLPSTPGAAETEAGMMAARHALETLATSERRGCALGAATALVGDWNPIRRLLDRTAARVSLDCPAPSLPDEASVLAVISQVSDSAATERALRFGSEQLLLQHRAVFDLLEARAEARGDY